MEKLQYSTARPGTPKTGQSSKINGIMKFQSPGLSSRTWSISTSIYSTLSNSKRLCFLWSLRTSKSRSFQVLSTCQLSADMLRMCESMILIDSKHAPSPPKPNDGIIWNLKMYAAKWDSVWKSLLWAIEGVHCVTNEYIIIYQYNIYNV